MIRYALSTEKSIRMMEAENKLVLIVDLKDNVKSIKEDVEKKLGAKVIKINTQVDSKGRKKAYVKFSEETPALDVATKLGLM
jgi:large subunit ribosomal protein L23